VEGLDRIMYTARGPKGQKLGWWDALNQALTWRTLYGLILIKGEPDFTLDEGMQAWDYIIEHFPAGCLGSKAEPPRDPLTAVRTGIAAPRQGRTRGVSVLGHPGRSPVFRPDGRQ